MIEIKHLNMTFERTVLSDVNCTINDGDVIAIIGPSGTGKSTLIKCINLLFKPTSGQIIVDGEDITAKGYEINKVRKKIGMVFQHFNLFSHLTVIENIMKPQIDLLGRTKQEAYDKAYSLLKRVGLTRKMLQYPEQLSGGQKQRVAICRTLALDPEVILFDEPTSALDPTMIGEVQSVIAELAKEGRTMIIVTHEFKFAQNVANRVFYMDQGIIYEDGTPDEIFNHPKKEKTIQFINSLSYLDILVNDENHDLNREIEQIHSFCISKGIDRKRTYNVCSCYEEYLAMLYNYAFGDDRTLRFALEYQASTDKLILSFTPYSLKNWDDIKDVVSESLENKIFVGHLKGKKEETVMSDDGEHIRYSYEL